MGDPHKNSLQRSGNWREPLSCLVEQILLREDFADVGKEIVGSAARAVLTLQRYDQTRNESLDDIIFSEME